MMNVTTEAVRFPISARMTRRSDGSYQITEAVYADIPFESVVRVFWQAYRADQEIAIKERKTA